MQDCAKKTQVYAKRYIISVNIFVLFFLSLIKEKEGPQLIPVMSAHCNSIPTVLNEAEGSSYKQPK